MPRKTRLALALAAGAVPFTHFLKPEGEGGGAGAAAPEKKPDDAPKKIELTEDELTQRITAATEAALNKERETAAQKAKREKEDAEREKAEKDGEFKTLAEKDRAAREAAEAERDAARLDKRKLEVKDQLRDYLAEKHPAHATCAKYIMHLVEFDLKTDEADIAKRIARAADEYVKDNPRQVGAGGAPAGVGRGQRASADEKPKQPETNNRERNGMYSMPARRGF